MTQDYIVCPEQDRHYAVRAHVSVSFVTAVLDKVAIQDYIFSHLLHSYCKGRSFLKD